MLMVFVNDIHSRPPCLNSNLEETLVVIYLQCCHAGVLSSKSKSLHCEIISVCVIAHIQSSVVQIIIFFCVLSSYELYF